MMKKISVLLFAVFAFFSAVWAQDKTLAFAQRDSSALLLDLYYPEELKSSSPCVVYIFGGGFLAGSRDTEKARTYCRALSEKGFVVVAVDYRLGLKNVEKSVGVFNIKPLENAIRMAADDVFSATAFLVSHAEELRIDTSRIILHGTSAGAITALQADFELANGDDAAKVLPAGFRYAGIVSFSGAIFTRHGKLTYAQPPAPTLMFHGTKDKLVNYNKIKFFNIGFFGTNSIVKRFEKFGFPYAAVRYRGNGHEIADLMLPNIDVVADFIQKYCFEKRFLQSDQTIYDPSVKSNEYGNFKPSDLQKIKD